MNLRWRAVFVLFLVVGGLIPLQSVSSAQSAGTELVEAVGQEASGEDAYVVVESVEAFPVDGGEAVFEPGTDYEETFTYASADASTNRLVGLTRPAPLAHSAGAFVEAPTPDAGEPDPSPTPTGTPSEPGNETGESQPDAQGAPTEGDSASTSDDTAAPTEGDASEQSSTMSTCWTERPFEECVADLLDGSGGDPCMIAVGKTCDEVLDDALGSIGDRPSTDDVCTALSTGCQEVRDILEGNTPEPCMVVLGTSCGELVEDILGTPTPDPCNLLVDKTCDEALEEVTGQFCDLWFPSAPDVGTVAGVGGLVVGDAAASCPRFPGIVLIVCMEYGPTPVIAVPHNCLPWEGLNRVDGYSASACAAGMWFTYARVIWTATGQTLADGHSSGSTIHASECATGDVIENLPDPL